VADALSSRRSETGNERGGKRATVFSAAQVIVVSAEDHVLVALPGKYARTL